jgi:hypothetical protein
MVKNKKYLVIILVLFVLLIVVKHYMPKPVNWDLSFNGYKKIPYGCSVMKDLLPIIFPGNGISVNDKSFYLTLDSTFTGHNLLIINSAFNPDNLDLETLLDFVSHGNTVFISSLSFSERFSDTLGFKTENRYFDTVFFKKKVEEKLHLRLPEGKNSEFLFITGMPDHFFVQYDTLNSKALGTDHSGKTDFIVQNFGNGKIYLHCKPLALTNFHILYSNYQYACSALSMLPVAPTIWDQYYKSDRFINNSPVRYILSNSALRSAYYVILCTLLIYLVFGSRRKQRPIPVVQALQNTSLDFIRSVGKLYYKTFNHADLAKKKLIYYNEFLRTKYNLKSPFNTPEELAIASKKTGVEMEIIERLSKRYHNIDRIWDYDEKDLMTLHQLLENFYKNCK